MPLLLLLLLISGVNAFFAMPDGMLGIQWARAFAAMVSRGGSAIGVPMAEQLLAADQL